MNYSAVIAAAVLAVVSVTPALAGDVKLPKNLSWTAYGTTSSGYAQSVGIGQMLKKTYDVDLRIIPGKNDISRMSPLLAGQSDLCACGIASYFAQEGVYMFADRQWGPQRILNLFNNIGRNGAQLVVAADSGVTKVADLKGKRVTWVRGAPALNVNSEAMLAFAGLTWDDVVKVEVPGWKQSADAVINGQADATFGSTVSSAYNQLAASPRGLFWVTLPHADTEGWKRANAVAPYWQKAMVSNAVAVEKNGGGKVPYEGSTYPYPIFISLQNLGEDIAYGLTKAVMDNYEAFKEAGPGMDGYQVGNQDFNWVFPYHPGAIRYYKEKGVWTSAHDKHNDQLLKRQDVLAAAWKEAVSRDIANADFEAEWAKIRAAHLDKAGMEVPFR